MSLTRPRERFQNALDDDDDQTQMPADSALLGIDDREAMPLILKLSSPDVAHIIISGNTGSGKTVLARSIVFSLAFLNDPADMRLVLIDPKRRGYTPFAGLPHLAHPVVAEAEQVVAVLESLIEEMLRRDAQSSTEQDGAQASTRKPARSRRKAAADTESERPAIKLDLGAGTPRIVVAIDELADLILNSGNAGKEIARLLTRLTLRGREAGIHVIACTQRPSTELLGGLSKSNFPTRMVGRVSSADDARVAAGIGSTGAERLLGQGDFLLVYRGEVQRFQAAHISAQEIQREVRRLREMHDQALIQQRRQDKERTQRAQLFQRRQLEDLDAGYAPEPVREHQSPQHPQTAHVLPAPPSRHMPTRHAAIADSHTTLPVQKPRPVRQPEPEPEYDEQEEAVEDTQPRSKKDMIMRFLRG